jgi:hypothetical protein
MEKTIFISLPIEDLQTVIIDCVNSCLRNNKREQSETTHTTIQYLSVKDTAKFLNLAPQTIYQLVSAGKLKNYKRNKRLYFLQSDLQNFIQQGERKTNAEIAIESQNYLRTKKA